jgi:hypothetical protein
MMGEESIGKNLEGSGRGLIEVRSQHLPGRSEENHKEISIRILELPAEI